MKITVNCIINFFRRCAERWRRKEPLFGIPNWMIGIVTLDFVRFRKPDFTVWQRGDIYLVRRWIFPRNPLLNVYLHKFCASDDDRALHDHPWLNLSILLRGCYIEHVPDFRGTSSPHVRLGDLPRRQKLRRAPALILRRGVSSHIIEIKTRTVWTLFITGPVFRDWGFHCAQGWVHWRDYLAPGDKSRVGKGCGE